MRVCICAAAALLTACSSGADPVGVAAPDVGVAEAAADVAVDVRIETDSAPDVATDTPDVVDVAAEALPFDGALDAGDDAPSDVGVGSADAAAFSACLAHGPRLEWDTALGCLDTKWYAAGVGVSDLRGTPCTFRTAIDGIVRCLPMQVTRDGFSEPSCTYSMVDWPSALPMYSNYAVLDETGSGFVVVHATTNGCWEPGDAGCEKQPTYCASERPTAAGTTADFESIGAGAAIAITDFVAE